jgi:alpha-N-arabinofuranosidase
MLTRSCSYWWNWTNTLGPLEDRAGFPGTWGYENTDGLGLIEYMLWAQDLGMEPLLAVWSGLWLNGTSLTLEELQPYIQSALDELEFLMGDASTPWGAKREALGYGPFDIKFVEVGNEDSLSKGGATYRAYRFKAFYDAISAAYPDITIIASFYDVDDTTGTPTYNASGDFHEYAIPLQMSSQFGYFDNYTSEHPILIGEYAVIEYDTFNKSGPEWYSGAPRALYPFWYGSVAEAIFLLGAERNSDKIIGSSYAPSFQNYNRWEWIPDLIEYDAYPGNTVLSTSYYMIQLLSNTRITENLPTTEATFGPAYWVAGRSDVTGSHILKAAVYNSTGNVPFNVNFEGVGAYANGKLTYLTAPMNASSTIGNNVVKTTTENVRANGQGKFSFSVPEYSVAVFEVTAENCGQGYHYGSKSSRRGWKGWKSWGKGPKPNWNQWGQGWW